MSNDTKFTILVAVLIFIGGGIGTLSVYLIKGATTWGQTQERLNGLADDFKKVAESTDKRLRWLEERIWGSGRANR